MIDKSDELYQKYVDKKVLITADIARLEAELVAARDRENLIEGMLRDMATLRGGRGVSAESVRPRAVSAPTATPVVADRSQGPGRGKGRASAAVAAPVVDDVLVPHTDVQQSSSSDISELSIVDAAILLASQRGQREAKASDVHAWFEEVGYRGRNGTPNRNSIYVSLNREANLTAEDADARIRKERRGVFKFL